MGRWQLYYYWELRYELGSNGFQFPLFIDLETLGILQLDVRCQ